MSTTTKDRQEFLTRLPTEDHQALRALSYFTGRSMNDIVCEALHGYLVDEGRRQHVNAVFESGESSMRELLDKLGD